MVACDLHDKTMLLMVSTLRARAKAAGGAQIVFAYEASGQGFGWYDELAAAGIACHVLA